MTPATLANASMYTTHVALQIGPRLELEVVKVEEGMCEGKVLFHSFVHKSAGEAAQQQQQVSQRTEEDELMGNRRRQQVSLLPNLAVHSWLWRV